LCDHVELGLNRETRRGRPVAALWAADEVVGVDGISLVFQIRYLVWRHEESPGEEDDNHPAPPVGAAVIDRPHLVGQDRAVARDPGLQFHDEGLGMARTLE